jgi:undecaprenyl-diphosphatase
MRFAPLASLIRFHVSRAARAVGFVLRHRWSVPFSILATGFFAHLAAEMRENELKPFDALVATAVGHARGGFDGPMLWLTRLGEGESLLVVGASCAALLLALRRPREVVFLAVVGAGALALDAGLKLAFQRARPEASELYLIHTPSSFSFPSGHALASTAVLFALVVVARVVGVRGVYLVPLAATALLLVLGIATSRVYFGVHFPSDVLGGLLAGAAWVSTVTGWFYPRVLPGEEVTPEPNDSH